MVRIMHAIKSEQIWENMNKCRKRSQTMSLRNKDVVLTTQQAVKYLKISKPTYFKYIALGRIKAVKAGRGWKVHQSELHRFLRVPNG